MLMAHDANQQAINATVAHRKTGYHCPGCQAPVQLKRGTVMTPHFAHQRDQACQTFSEGETAEHLLGKQQLAAWFLASGYKVQLEAPLTAIHQRPDLLVQLPGQKPLAIEFQCSPLAVPRLKARTLGYRQHGYRVLWVLGTPYQQARLRPTSKALKFLQYNQQWGCYLAFWDVQQVALCLRFNLLGFDGDPLQSQRQLFWSQRQPVDQLMTYRPTLLVPQIVAEQFQRRQRRLVIGRLTRQPRFMALQTLCYQHGGTLATLPLWVYPMQAKLPILTTAFLAWQVQLFIALRKQPVQVWSLLALRQLIWQTLQPCLAPMSCIETPRHLCQHLIQTCLNELMTKQVIRPVAGGWRVVQRQLAWR
ncbi:competence protein CoiA [Lactiplantibacillus daowaiensis]|nr:competence protein CoiA family protein [Lactiplantibacillus daowaiensis]